MPKNEECSTRNRPFIVGLNARLRLAVLFRPNCGMWACPVCARVNRARWAVRTWSGSTRLVEQGEQLEFLTLTSHEKLDPGQTVNVFRHAWDQVNKRARRARPTYQYIVVPEQHVDGRLHVHAVETAALGSRWWKDNARECGLGYIAEETEVYSPEGAAWYVTKYISKTLGVTTWPRGFRRVRTSRGWPPLPVLPLPDGWRFELVPRRLSLDEFASRLEVADYDVTWSGGAAAWSIVRGEDQ